MIDEKKLIEELEKKPFIHGRYDHKNGNVDFISGIETWHETVMHEIENAPKVGEWIPCSERLPEEDVDVLVCIKDGYGNYYQTVTYHHIVWQTEVGGMYSEIIAWQPLPEPYKGE